MTWDSRVFRIEWYLIWSVNWFVFDKGVFWCDKGRWECEYYMWTFVPRGLAVRIPGSHPGGPGSTPGAGVFSASALHARASPQTKLQTNTEHNTPYPHSFWKRSFIGENNKKPSISVRPSSPCFNRFSPHSTKLLQANRCLGDVKHLASTSSASSIEHRSSVSHHRERIHTQKLE